MSSISAKRLERSVQKTSNWLVFCGLLFVCAGLFLIHRAEVIYEDQERLLNEDVAFEENIESEEAIRRDENFGLLLRNGFFSEWIDESKFVIKAKRHLGERGLKLDGRYFSNLWDLLNYLHVTGNREAAFSVEYKFSSNSELWSVPRCSASDVSRIDCDTDNENEINLSRYFEHINNVYLIPAIEYHYTGQYGLGYNFASKVDDILEKFDISIHNTFDLDSLNKAYVLGALASDIYNGRISIGHDDTLFLMSAMNYSGFEPINGNAVNSILADYVDGVNFLRENCFRKASKKFESAIRYLEDNKIKDSRIGSLLSYLQIRSMVTPFYDVRKLQVHWNRVPGENADDRNYLENLVVDDCGNKESIMQWADLAEKTLEASKVGIVYGGLRNDVQEYAELIPDRDEDGFKLARSHAALVCRFERESEFEPSLVIGAIIDQESIEKICRIGLRNHKAPGQEPVHVNVLSNAQHSENFESLGRRDASVRLLNDSEHEDESENKLAEESTREVPLLNVVGNWIQIFSRDDRSIALDLAEEVRASVSADVSVFQTESGPFVVALGPYASININRLLIELKNERKIPEDSLVKDGSLLGELISGERGLLILNIQNELDRLGCNIGMADGDWGPTTAKAFREALQQLKSDATSNYPNHKGLLDLRKAKDGACRISFNDRSSKALYSELKVSGEWIQIFSRQEYTDAELLAEEYLSSVSDEVSVFEHLSGLYVVAIGPFGPGNAKKWREKLTTRGKIPSDSVVKQGAALGQLLWGGKGLLVLNIQDHLMRLGCNPGAIDGDWGKDTKTAFRTAINAINSNADGVRPSMEALIDLAKAEDRACVSQISRN